MSQPQPIESNNHLTIAIFLIPLVIVNLILLLMAWQDRSWGALGIAIFIGPIANGILLILGLLAVPFVRAAAKGGLIADYVAWAFISPIAAAGLDFFIIWSMGLHGC